MTVLRSKCSFVSTLCQQFSDACEAIQAHGRRAKPRCHVRYRPDGGIIKASLKADGAARGKSVRNPNAEANVVTKFAPLPDQLPDGRSHINHHQYGLEGGVIYRNWIVEYDHHPVTSIAFKRAAILDRKTASQRSPRNPIRCN